MRDLTKDRFEKGSSKKARSGRTNVSPEMDSNGLHPFRTEPQVKCTWTVDGKATWSALKLTLNASISDAFDSQNPKTLSG